MANTNIDGTISTLFHGMDGFVSSKSVVGDPINRFFLYVAYGRNVGHHA